MSELVIESEIGMFKPPGDKSPTILPRLPTSGTSVTDLSTPSLHAKDLQRVHAGRRSTVYRATLVRDGCEPLDVVLKTDLYKYQSHHFIREAEIYENQAKDLQGIVIPRFYGMFQGQVDGTVMTCLVLEYCGKRMDRIFADADVEFNMYTLEKLMWLHDSGVVHNDISEANIVSKDGVPFLIDLEFAKPHKCERMMDIVEDAMEPPQHEFGCEELYLLAREMGVWTYPYMNVYGQTFAKQSIRSAQHLASMAPGYHSQTPEQRRQTLEVARSVEIQVAR